MKKIYVQMSPIEKEALIRKHYKNDPSLQLILKKGINLDFFMDSVQQLYVSVIEKFGSDEEYIYKIPAVEVRRILKKQVKENPETFATNKTIPELIRQDGYLIFYLSEDDWTDEMVSIAVKKDKNIYTKLPVHYQQKFAIKKAYVDAFPYLVSQIKLSEEELVCIIKENPDIFTHISRENVTQNTLYAFLERLIKSEYAPSSYYWNNIPDEFKDKVYYQARSMANPYYLKDVPDEYKCYKLYAYIYEHMLDKKNSYTCPLSVLQYFPDNEITEEMALTCCVNHFSSVKLIPDKYKNDDFYRKLISNGMYSFIQTVDLYTISSALVEECLRNIKPQFWFWQEKFPKNFWTPGIVKEYARVSPMFFKHVPAKLITEEDAITNLVIHKSIEEFPKKYLSEKAIDALMTNSYGIIGKIPDKYKTDAFYKKHIANHNLCFKDIPLEYITEEVITSYIAAGKTVNFERIPQSMITEEMIYHLYQSNQHYHFSQGYQSPQITTWIFNAIKEISGIKEVRKYLYMFSHITTEVFLELCETFSVSVIISSILPNYITEDICDVAYNIDPQSIVYFPEKLKEKYRKMEESEKCAEKVLHPVANTANINNQAYASDDSIIHNEITTDITETFVQLSLFDFIAS